MKRDIFYFDKYKKIIDEIGLNNKYDDNIKHLLYVVIPAFIYKYGIEKESLILECLKSTVFVVSDLNDLNYEAFFDRKIINIHNDVLVQKFIVINGLIKNEYIHLIDSVVHEFNHALNSMINEITISKNGIMLRTGLSYVTYTKEIQKKSDSYLLEEVINTKQSEDIISMIYDFKYDGDDIEIKNLLYTILRERENIKYKSDAYSIFMECCKRLIDNKTFIKTVEVYRLNGDIDYIQKWFDDISGKSGQYNKLIYFLVELNHLIKKYEKAIFKKRIKIKILNKMKQINEISEDFCVSTVYK